MTSCYKYIKKKGQLVAHIIADGIEPNFRVMERAALVNRTAPCGDTPLQTSRHYYKRSGHSGPNSASYASSANFLLSPWRWWDTPDTIWHCNPLFTSQRRLLFLYGLTAYCLKGHNKWDCLWTKICKMIKKKCIFSHINVDMNLAVHLFLHTANNASVNHSRLLQYWISIGMQLVAPDAVVYKYLCNIILPFDIVVSSALVLIL